MILKPDDIRNENGIAVSKQISRCTPMLCIRAGGAIVPVASGLFLKYEENHFLITAAHVLNSYGDKGLGVFFKYTFLSLGGRHVVSKERDNGSDYIDIGIYHLSTEFLSQLSSDFLFFDLANVNIDHDDAVDDFSYLVFGYPVTRVEVNDYKRKITLKPFVFLTGLEKSDVYLNFTTIQMQSHLLVSYDRNRIMKLPSKDVGQGPTPNGLSGCGVWRVSDTLVHDVSLIRFFPSGILVEYYAEHKVFIVTRLRIVTEMIRKIFIVNFPKSRLISIK